MSGRKGKRDNNLYRRVIEKLTPLPRGSVLDAGTGSGALAEALSDAGFRVTAADIDASFFRADRPGIRFIAADFNETSPFEDGSFDCVTCLEMIEHVENPFALLRELYRVLKPGGTLVISTPNILNIRSRLRFLLEGNYDYFKYPLPEWEQDGTGANLHVNPIRLHEMEYYVRKAGFVVEEVFTSNYRYGLRWLFPLEWAIRLQTAIKVAKSRRPGEIDLTRLYRHVMSDDLLFGEHLVIRAAKARGVRPAGSGTR